METCDVINPKRTFGSAPNAIYILGLCEITFIFFMHSLQTSQSIYPHCSRINNIIAETVSLAWEEKTTSSSILLF